MKLGNWEIALVRKTSVFGSRVYSGRNMIKLNERKKFRTQLVGYTLSFVLLLVFIHLMMSERRVLGIIVAGAFCIPCLVMVIHGLRFTTIYFNKEMATASMIFRSDISIPLNSIVSIRKIHEPYSNLFDFPSPKRRFSIGYFDAEGKIKKIKFSIVLDAAGNQNLASLVDLIKFRNPDVDLTKM